MKLIKVTSSEPVIANCIGLLRRHLEKGERVLWLVSGGSVIPIVAEVARHLTDIPVAKLTISLTDERPGPVGHPDSNWLGLQQSGFQLPGAHLRPILTGSSTYVDTADFSKFLDQALDRADYRFGIFGIGPDGHTAGIPARYPAPFHEPAMFYSKDGFERISITPAGIGRLDEAAVYMAGENKHEAFDLFQLDLRPQEQSAQYLKIIPKLTVYNEFKGD
jgi:6-phosphogluconolactonase/glucosamine-6-phosphate isomerase/deaminase